jgi:hypothetical protein
MPGTRAGEGWRNAALLQQEKKMAKRFLVHSFTGAPVADAGHEVQEYSINEMHEVVRPTMRASDYNGIMEMKPAQNLKITPINAWYSGRLRVNSSIESQIIHRIE